uniref:FBA_2 domain-containing protein n=1 Tax=Caenorhabditis tropicalis TaxID=1561998 RepID=A0A1I7U9L2_9PELO
MKRWVFSIDTEPRGSENSINMYSDSWVPNEGTYKAKITRLPILGITYSIRLHSSEDLFSGIYTFLEHLSDIFHFTISAMKLVLDDFSEQESRRIIDMFFGKNSNQNPTKKLTLENHGDINDQLVQSILKQQKATCILKLNTELSPEFHFDLNSLENHVNEISVHNSEWVSVEDIINLEKARVLLLIIPTFTYEKIKKLIEKWRDGWMPKWEQLVIHTHESVDIDTYMLEEFPTINPPERMIQHVESGWIMGMDDRTAYSMLRRDGSIAKVTTGNAFVILSIYTTTDRQYVDAHSIFK